MEKNPTAPGYTGSLVQRAYDWLKGEIMADRLAAGQTIDDREIAADLGLSRTPVREAIQRLAWEGLVDIRHTAARGTGDRAAACGRLAARAGGTAWRRGHPGALSRALRHAQRGRQFP